ncbi:MAG TPA: FG-GAP-like repeat-containing protein, partial [Chryseolinea sp.]|nr:FG-GAP-like repeat-containing protein [Chryseolinea sp.]
TIPSIEWDQAALGDFDGDGDLDISSLSGAFKNNSASANAAPVAPVVTGSNVSGSSVELLWQVASDDKTPTQSLTYNISVRSEDGTIIVPAHALPSGRRQIFKMGNAWNSLSFNLSCLKEGKYYWKVQTLDASYQGSSFSPEQSFTISTPPPVAPSALTATTVSDWQIDLSWEDHSTTEDWFIIFKKLKDEDDNFFYPFDTVAANETHFSDSVSLFADTEYVYKVVASNCAYPDEFFSNNVSAKTFPRAFEDNPWLNLDNTAAAVIVLGDIDNDGDLDMFMVNSGSTGKILRFGPAGYEDSGINISFSASHALWLDYNNDGFIDLLLYRSEFSTTTIRKLYKNENGTNFTEVDGVGIPKDINWQAGISLGDYDNDGDEDILVQAASGIHIYDNNGRGKFSRNTKINLAGRLKSAGSFSDFDQDGDLDILAIKGTDCSPYTLIVFENKLNDTFVTHELNNLQGLSNDYLNFTGDMEWGDYDNDGYPDIIISGESTCSNGDGITRIYHNNGAGGFEVVSNLVPLIYDPNVDWGDYDNDGDLDVFAYGNPRSAYSSRARVYRNDGGQFKETNINYLLQDTQNGKTARGDIDGDGDMDYVVAGQTDYPRNVKLIAYRNTYSEDWGRPNHKPSAPQSPQSLVNGQSVTLTWSKAEDHETKNKGLTYNLYIIDDKDSILTNSYSLENGQRKVVSFGNASSQTTMKLRNLKAGTYRWAVQAIDKGFTGSEFSQENTFVIGEPIITSVEDRNEKEVTFYPNPASTFLSIISEPENGSVLLEITNSVGQPAMKIVPDKPEFQQDISSLPPGLYVVSVFKKGSKVDVQKLIKK